MAKDFVTASELNQLASSWGSHRFHSCYYRNVILNFKFKLKGKKEAIFYNNENKPTPFFSARGFC